MASKKAGPASAYDGVIRIQPEGLRFITFLNPKNICYLISAVQLIWLTPCLRTQILACSDELISETLASDAGLLDATLLVRKIRTIFEEALAMKSHEIPTFDLLDALRHWAALKPDGNRVTIATVGDVTLPFAKILSAAQQIYFRQATIIIKSKGGTCTSTECQINFPSTTLTITGEPEQLFVIPLTFSSDLLHVEVQCREEVYSLCPSQDSRQ